MDPRADRAGPERGRLGGNTLNPQGGERMRTLSRTLQAAARVALWMLTPSVLLAQGTSPWMDGPASRASIPPPAVLREAR